MIEVADSNTVSYYHFDGLGNVVALSDSAGDTVQTYEYSVYGQVAASDPNHPNPYLFTGRRFDTETGLYYYRARYYNPYIGRFMQTDPVGYDDGINWYLYGNNNPLNWVDPSGTLTMPYPGDPCEPDEPDEPEEDDWVTASVIATVLAWADVFGLFGDFGHVDYFDEDLLKDLINPYPDAGEMQPVQVGPGFWTDVHYGFGVVMALIGIDRESAENLMEVWEWTEPGLWSGFGWWEEYIGRDNFEGGEEGWEFDIKEGLRGYDDGVVLRDMIGEILEDPVGTLLEL